MPTVPFAPKPQPRQAQVDDTFVAMAAADLHEAGMLFEPVVKAGTQGTDKFSTDKETLDEMDSHIPPESKGRPLPGRMYDKPPKDVG